MQSGKGCPTELQGDRTPAVQKEVKPAVFAGDGVAVVNIGGSHAHTSHAFAQSRHDAPTHHSGTAANSKTRINEQVVRKRLKTRA